MPKGKWEIERGRGEESLLERGPACGSFWRGGERQHRVTARMWNPDSYSLSPWASHLNSWGLSVLIYKMEIIILSALPASRRPWCGKPHMRHSLWKGLAWSTITLGK